MLVHVTIVHGNAAVTRLLRHGLGKLLGLTHNALLIVSVSY